MQDMIHNAALTSTDCVRVVLLVGSIGVLRLSGKVYIHTHICILLYTHYVGLVTN